MEYKEDSKLCIVIIPGAGKVKRIVIPKWLPKFIIGFTIVISIFFTFYNNKVTAFTNSLQSENMDKNYIKYELEKKFKV